MRSKGHSRKTSNKFLRFIKLILKALGKARDFYVRSLETCASKINYGHCPNHFSVQEYHDLPMRFSKISSETSNVEIEEELMKLIRAASPRRTNHENEIDMFSPKRLRMTMKSRGLPKNMGRIDEDMPCEFQENDVDVDFLVAGKKSRFGIIRSKNHRSICV